MKRLLYVLSVLLLAVAVLGCQSSKSSSSDSGDAPVADFTASPLSGDSPLEVTFTNTSTGTITSHMWDFGDGQTSAQASPVHIYDTDGLYTVSLTVVGPGSSDTKTRTSYITVGTVPGPDVDFTADPLIGTAPLEVTFTDQSTGTNVHTWSWDFGDGGSSTEQHLVYTYNAPGSYSVTLTATDDNGTKSATKTDFITVTGSGSEPGSGGSGGATGVYTDSITVGSKNRDYLVYCPSTIQDPAPLLVFFHGMGASYNDGYYAWGDTVQTEGFIIVCLQALGGSWDFNDSSSNTSEDIDFVEALVDKLEGLYNIAIKREYLSGFSNGGFYSIFVGISRSERFGALQSHSGGYMSGLPTDATRKIPIYLIHGESDSNVPISCSEQAYTIYTGKGHEVKFDRIPGLGHGWTFDKTGEVWDWFMARPLP